MPGLDDGFILIITDVSALVENFNGVMRRKYAALLTSALSHE
jgi:hypothetical protein